MLHRTPRAGFLRICGLGLGLFSAAYLYALPPASAQIVTDAAAREGFALKFAHKDIIACLENVQRACTLTAPVQAVLEENAEGEQASILIGVAKALLDLKDYARAEATLRLAQQKAESSGLPIIFQQRLQEIAPLMARAGNAAAALEIANEVRFGRQRDRVLADLAEIAARAGDLDQLRLLAGNLRNKSRAFWTELNLIGQAPSSALAAVSRDAYLQRVRAMPRSDYVVRGLGLVAIIAHKQGDIEFRDALFAELREKMQPLARGMITADVMATLVESMHKAGLPADIITPYYGLARQNLTGSGGGDGAFARYARRVTAFVTAGEFNQQILAILSKLSLPEERLAVINRIAATTPQGLADKLFAQARTDILTVENALDRDSQRLLLADTAARLKNRMALEAIARSMEDDDSLARALARLAPLVS